MRHRFPKGSQLKSTKQRYSVRNWSAYQVGLRQPGSPMLWFSEEAIALWRAPIGEKPGGQPVYASLAIEAALTIRLVYGLALRQTEGFLRSVSRLLDLDLRIPDHTTLSRRSKDVNIKLPASGKVGAIDILVDRTGLRVHRGNSAGVHYKASRGVPLLSNAHALVLERQEGSRLKDTIRVADSACYGPCSEPKDSLDQHTCLERRSLHDFEEIQVLLWHRNLMIFNSIHKNSNKSS